MEQATSSLTCKFRDQTTSDIVVHLKTKDNNKSQHFNCHSPILAKASKFFSDRLSQNQIEPSTCIEVECTALEFDHYAKLLNLLYIPEESILEELNSVKSTIGVLKAANSLGCEDVKEACIKYLEAVPWDEKEEEEIVKLVESLGPEAAPILARVQPVSQHAAQTVFISAIRFATSVASPIAGFSDELKTSAQEQLEYMLLEDGDGPLVVMDEKVKSELRIGLKNLFENFKSSLNLLSYDFERKEELAEERLLIVLNDLDWVCGISQKMEIMLDFVSNWAEISCEIINVILSKQFSLGLWQVKSKIMEITSRALDAVGYGSVVISALARVQFLKTWLPYVRKMKPLLESTLESEIWENMEGAIVSFILALPSNDQAEIILEWVNGSNRWRYPDLSEAFEVWCYRAKTAKRRLTTGLNGVENHTISF
ncbi:BTB/POZ domain-containing protein [Rhynchospora pubera]|uniref:BTB/POZ domain-containing protein n=1 Tax=Rhynchospora pubera TaxID=906938 RepID=A0AAV8EEG6_9POAL|nr:BTB/POZ domain-containing protein [Rhynchospora pubera]